MSITRREVCKRLGLLPLAGLLSGCPELGSPPGITVDFYGKNENVDHVANVFINNSNKGDTILLLLEKGKEDFKELDNVAFPFVATVHDGTNAKLLASKSIDEDFLTSNGARPLGSSQLSILVYENTVKGKTKVNVIFVGEALGAHH